MQKQRKRLVQLTFLTRARSCKTSVMPRALKNFGLPVCWHNINNNKQHLHRKMINNCFDTDSVGQSHWSTAAAAAANNQNPLFWAMTLEVVIDDCFCGTELWALKIIKTTSITQSLTDDRPKTFVGFSLTR